MALAPGSVGASKRWTYYPEAARLLAEHGLDVWVVGGPGEKALAAEIVAAGGPRVRDLTGTDLRNGILAMAAADVAISNDSGLMHIAAAIGTPTMGIFGPTSPYHWAPLNGLAATVQTKTTVPCQPCHRPVCTMNDHRCMRDIPASDVVGHRRARAGRGRSPRDPLTPPRGRACAAVRRSLPQTRLQSRRCVLSQASNDPIAAHLKQSLAALERATAMRRCSPPRAASRRR